MVDEYSEKRVDEFYKKYKELPRAERIEIFQKILTEEFSGEEIIIKDKQNHHSHNFEACVDEYD
jgi:hypothetical protein